ncbi:hypothetical protein ACNJX9_34590 [Bradyrhizobium sp. DASA03076]|uniref:hypothetical protein n=1 Tax=Bradyrhizobium sp. BLXBL-03 TaxID=3395916 RepID=UPI003F71BFB0
MPRYHHFVSGKTFSALLDRILLPLSAVTTAMLFAWVLYYSSYGLNIGDEGYWLTSMANPFAYRINIPPSLFGVVYHEPYHWVKGDVAMLRMANVTLTMLLGWILSFLVIRRFWTAGWLYEAVLSAGFGSLALAAFHDRFLVTPSYYTLNIQSVLLVMIGLLLADRPGRIRQFSGWFLVGVGGWCCFMARPTTAAALALVVMLYVIVLRRTSLLPMLAAALVALALVIITGHLIGGGITGLVARTVNGAEAIMLLGAGHEVSHIFRIDWLATSRSQLAIAVLLATALLFSILMRSTLDLLSQLALIAALIVTITIAVLGTDPISIKPSTLFLVPAFACAGATLYREGMVLRSQAPCSMPLALVFLVLPHLLALGSNLNYWIIGSYAALLWMLAVVAYLAPLAQEGRSVATLLPLTVLAQLLTASVVNTGMLKPFFQAKDLRTYTATMHMPGGGKLVISQLFHDYLATARVEARAAGLEIGAGVVDLTGHSPTLLYVLETQALGLPWLIGGYPDSSAIALEALRLEKCADLAKGWILIEPGGPRHLDQTSIMSSFGAEPADYVPAATFETPVLGGDYPNAHKQFLLRPARPTALAEQSCHEARRRRPASQKWTQS